MKTITVVSPCFNEQDNVRGCYDVVKQVFERDLPGYRRQHIFADNASADRTPEILRDLAAQDPDVSVIMNARNFGVLRSTFNALRYSRGDATLVLLPVDLQDPPEHLPEFVKYWEEGFEVVAGARSNREEGAIMRACRWAFYRIVNSLSDFRISPDIGEFQLIDRKVLNAVLAHRDHYPYIRGIIASCGFRTHVIHYTWRARARGISKHNILSLIDIALNGIFSFTRAPMRFCTLAGLAISTLCILFAILSIILYFANSSIAPRGVTTLIVAFFFLSGIQLIFIGMLGEYVTSIHAQVRGGPIVIEREALNVTTPESKA